MKRTRPSRRVKILEDKVRRMVDICGSAVLILLCAPLLLFTALAIWINDRGPALYRQDRVGLRGRTFRLIKFRSMRVNTINPVELGRIGEAHPMVTPIGRWIRRFKVDELPQLFNVLRGDMRLIGPRPTIREQVDAYTEFQRRRLEVPPGMTGWAQVNGGINISWEERIMLDVWYIDHRSLWLDLIILWRTVSVVLFGEELDPQALRDADTYASRYSWIA